MVSETITTTATGFRDISSLVIKGGGKITISETGEIKGAEKATKKGSELHLEGPGGVSILSSGSNVFMNGMSFIGNIVGSGTTYRTHGGRGSSISQSNGVVNISCAPGTKIVVNGNTIEWEDSPATPAPPLPSYRIDTTTCEIKEISLTGSASLLIRDFRLCAKSMKVEVSGSGDVTLPGGVFDNLDLRVRGSGDIIGTAKTSANNLLATVTGSGDIKRIHVIEAGLAKVVGSGDISLSTPRANIVTEQVVGTGDITIKVRN